MIMLLVACTVYHVFVMLLARRHAGFEATLKVVCYSTGVNIFYFLPFLGGLIGGLWQLLLLTVGLKEIHRISAPRAIAIALIPHTILFMLATAFMLWAVTGSRFDIENLSLDMLLSIWQ